MIDTEVDVFLEHFGIKGMRWGVRNAKALGSGSKKTALSIGRGSKRVGSAVGSGTKKTVNWVKDHPKLSASIAAGATFAASAVILKKKLNDIQVSRDAAVGKKWLDKWLSSQREYQRFMLIDNWPKPRPPGRVARFLNSIRNF